MMGEENMLCSDDRMKLAVDCRSIKEKEKLGVIGLEERKQIHNCI